MDKILLEQSLALVAADDPDFTVRFYERLFADYPEVKALFGKNIRPQATMLQEAIVAVLEHLDDPGWLETSLSSLGRVHASLGVTPKMYGWVATTLVATMADIAGPQWTDVMSKEWNEALTAVAAMMLDAYPPESPGQESNTTDQHLLSGPGRGKG
ncbi:globin domain-containing protein [Nocardia sp. 348MFTsu5.1]|uniref:globin domain-containing protein n=1 Tax=Nocardia sp. 348MFTsu5.1 TaxID=1172185 RepID=UPI00036EF13D|nr:globin domain-containing protein [Nocardia sp. 348MFTsu5.1]